MKRLFDSVHRKTLWKIMERYGIPSKLFRMVSAMYDGIANARLLRAQVKLTGLM